jgi:hypothetical protein
LRGIVSSQYLELPQGGGALQDVEERLDGREAGDALSHHKIVPRAVEPDEADGGCDPAASGDGGRGHAWIGKQLEEQRAARGSGFATDEAYAAP